MVRYFSARGASRRKRIRPRLRPHEHQAGFHRNRLRRHDVQGRGRLGRRDDHLHEAAPAPDQLARRTERGRHRVGRGGQRLPGRERPRLGSGDQRGPGDPRPVRALRRARALGEPARSRSTGGISTARTARRWRTRRGAPCRWSSATTARSAASARRSACAAPSSAGVLMLAPGSGLGSAYIDATGLPLQGDTLAGMETAHMAAPLHLLGAKPYPCGCGRTWGCVELYTTLAGLPYLLDERLAVAARSPAGVVDEDAARKGAGAARPGAAGRRAGRRAVRLPGARDGAAHREPVPGARSRSSS